MVEGGNSGPLYSIVRGGNPGPNMVGGESPGPTMVGKEVQGPNMVGGVGNIDVKSPTRGTGSICQPA
jgi:hypothetical protein